VVATLIPANLANSVVANVLSSLAFLCLWVAIGIAVLKYRLYEIDVVISKAVLYGSLAVFITGVYVGLVAGVGTLIGNRHSALLAALAAAVVAVAFQPVRQWAGRLANRVVYGRRASPYQVLSDFARRIGGTYASEPAGVPITQVCVPNTGTHHRGSVAPIGGSTRAGADRRPVTEYHRPLARLWTARDESQSWSLPALGRRPAGVAGGVRLARWFLSDSSGR
jgi:hypothetical protein